MAIVMKELSAALAGKGDMFLHVQAKRAGKIKGEAHQPGFDGDILVQGWRWGLAQSSALGHTQALSRRSYSALTVIKSIDLATTGLMSALATNDEIKEARLSMRKAGGTQEEYFVIVLEGARICSVSHEAAADGSVLETIEIGFNTVSVEYRPQKGTGVRGGTTSFTDSLGPSYPAEG